MKRNNSALSLKNLAMSIKQSICLQAQRTTKRELTLLREARSSGSLQLKNQNVLTKMKEIKMNKEQKQNKIFILQKQITYIQKQMEADKSSIRNYTKQLGQFEVITNKIDQNQKKIEQQQSVTEQMRNQICMLTQQIESIRYNSEQRIAQKQYYQELLQTYENQYQSESKQVFKILQLQQKNTDLRKQIRSLQQNIQASQNQFKEWKASVQFDLNEHKLKNSLKIVRLQLIQCEDKCDQFCIQNSLRKLRQLFCLYFKNYSKANGISNEPVENGIDIYICKNGLVQDFSQFLRQRLIYNKPRSQSIQRYLQTLIKMEQIFKKSNSQVNNKLYSYFRDDIQELIASKQLKTSQIKHNQLIIKETMEKVDLLFNNQSIAVIQYMRQQNHNKYDIKQIKNKLRQNKKQQRNRIQKMKQSFKLVKSLQQIIEKQRKSTKILTNKELIIQIQDNLIHSENIIDQLQFKLQKLNNQKDNIENVISNAISKWKERDDNKIKLKKLYSQLHRAKQQNAFALTKNVIDSPSIRKQSNSNSKSLKKQELQQTSKPKHNKNPSIFSLKQTKSVLSLSNPFKRIMDRESEICQPTISNCQMIISRKLSSKDVQTKQFTYNEQKERSNFGNMTHNVDMKKIKKEAEQGRVSNKQYDRWKIRNQKETVTTSKYKISIKPNTCNNPQGKISQSQRISLSKLLLSKFNR